MMVQNVVICLAAAVCCAWAYDVRLQRLMTSPILSAANSPFDYNYNAAYLPLAGGSVGGLPIDCLAVRVQDMIGAIAPSKIAVFCESADKHTFSREPYVVIDPSQNPAQADGCEDPRIQLLPDNNTLLMFYSAVNSIPNGGARSKLSLASCTVSTDPQCRNWTLHGAVFPEIFWSKSGALLVRPQGPPHYLFWGDTNISIATTTNFMQYENLNQTILTTRPDFFDSALVESGPPPLLLSDGNHIFLYNSAKVANKPSPKQGWNLEYHVGYAIVDAQTESSTPVVVERSSTPLMSPLLGWETCNDASMVSGLTPNVVFINGAKPLETPNTFLLYYQGCDAKTGLALLTVTVS